MGLKPQCFPPGILLLITLLTSIAAADIEVYSVLQRQVGTNGEVSLIINGTGFDKNQFSLNDPTKGNMVILRSTTQYYLCTTVSNGCTETRIECKTPRLPVGKFDVYVYVDGIAVKEDNRCAKTKLNCQIQTSVNLTPTITSVEPKSGPPGTILRLSGKIFTTRTNSSIVGDSTNGITATIRRVYTTAGVCDIRNPDTADLYGVGLDDDEGYNGFINCKISTNYVGQMNVSYIVTEKYGRSKADLNALRVTPNGNIAMFTTYAEISSVTPNKGSVNGGTLVNITGNYLNNTDVPPRVHIGDSECDNVTILSMMNMVCTTPKKPVLTNYPGNRGARKQEWVNADYEGRANLDASSPGYSESFTDLMESSSYTNVKTVSRFTAYFNPPQTAAYSFQIKCDNKCEFRFSEDGSPGSATKVAWTEATATSYLEFNTQRSAYYQLNAGRRYYIEMTHGSLNNNSFVQARAHTNTSLVTPQMSYAVTSEVQSIVLNSDVSYEKQEIKVTGCDSTVNFIPEKQSLVINGISDANNAMFYNVTVFNATSAGVRLGGSAADLEEALNAIPGVPSDTFNVTGQTEQTSTTKTFEITYRYDFGNIVPMVVNCPELVSCNVAKTQAGVSGKRSFRLSMDGLMTSPIACNAPAEKVKNAVEELFKVQCPRSLNQKDNLPFYDYEETKGWGGQRESDFKAFCGQFFMTNPESVYTADPKKSIGINLANTPIVCFAYKGAISNSLTLKYTFKRTVSGSTTKETKTVWRNFITNITATEQWRYTCLDLKDFVSHIHNADEVNSIYVLKVKLNRLYDEDFYVDTFKFTPISVLKNNEDFQMILQQRRTAATVDDNPIQVRTVTKMGENRYAIEMAPQNCGFKVPLLGLHSSSLQSGNTDLRTSDTATFTLPTAGGTSMTLTTTRIISASPPISGPLILVQNDSKFHLTLDPKCDLKMLHDIGIGGEVAVTHHGNCSNFQYRILWKTRKGQLPKIGIDANEVKGNNVRINVVQNSIGGVFFDPIPGDILSTTRHDKPQLRVVINGIPSNCTGDCSFDYDDNSTPHITSVSPTSGSEGTGITIQGSGFSINKDDNKVMIGRIPCVVTSSDTNKIECTVGDGGGSHLPVKLNVHPFGIANGNQNFSYSLVANSLTPSSGSLAGGTNITISGSGFRNAIVLVDGKNCTRISGTFKKLYCHTPKGTEGEKVVKVRQGSVETVLTPKFTYTTTLTPKVTSATPLLSPVSGGANLTLLGSGFGTDISMVTVKIGNKSATVTDCLDSKIVATIPDHPPGSFNITVRRHPHGFANNSGIGKFEFILKVNNFSPKIGSVYGGANISVSGRGFGTDASKVRAKFGPYNCTIDSDTLTDTQFQCTISRTGKQHVITNQGSTTGNGKGYRWNPAELHARVGDNITWHWNAPDYMQGIVKYGVYYDNCSAPIQQPFFSSGEQKSKGSFSYAVTTPGNFYYHSGFVDASKRIKFWGLIVVKAAESSVESLTVQRENYTALFVPSINRKKRSSTSTTQSPCPALTLPASCPIQTSSSNTFSLNTCLNCKVTSISTNTATSEDEITLYGSTFGSQNCQNKIKFGNYHCQPVFSSATEVKCKVQPNGQMENINTSPVRSVSVSYITSGSTKLHVLCDELDLEVGIPMKITFDLSNTGYCNIEIKNQTLKQFTLLPHVKTCNPQKSSELGGARLTINGGGFISGNTTVNIGGKKCENETVTYSEITCDIPKADKIESKPIEVKVKNMTAKTPSSCFISFTKFDTPEVTSVKPMITTKSTETFTIEMDIDITNLHIHVAVGQIPCTAVIKNNKQITCTAKNLYVGEHVVHVKIPSGNAKSTQKIKINGVLTLISPSKGSINGGTLITITGNGFLTNKTEVKIGGSNCSITNETSTKIVCLTPPGNSIKGVVVVSNGFLYTPQLSFTYEAGLSPVITLISPTSGKTGAQLTVIGTNFGQQANVLAGAPCTVTSVTATQIICVLGDHSAADVNVTVNNTIGKSNHKLFSYSLSASVSSSQGCFGGGHRLTITGHGFNNRTTSVTVCGTNCTMSKNKNDLSGVQLICYTPSFPFTGTTDKTCEVQVTENGKVEKLTYVYTFSQTPSISSVNPNTVTKGVATVVTLTGKNFGSDKNVLNVSIGGQKCTINSIIDTEIICETTTVATDSKKAIDVTKSNCGNAVKGNFDFTVVQRWSSPDTWGGVLPQKDEFIVIKKGASILLDVDTPILEFLLIDGGTLKFDEAKNSITLNAKFILITNRGFLQVGTKQRPYTKMAIILLHGHPRSPEIPVYGTKTLAVRNGTLDLHGKPKGITWTKLSRTAYVGDSTIHLKHSVEWQKNDSIVIATTGGKHSQKETEVRYIKNVKDNGITLELNLGLNYNHSAFTEQHGSLEIEMAAEVGLLSHNVILKGSENMEFAEKIEACPAGFDTGEFATQTCFQGRFGEEVGSDEFGGALMIHSPSPESDAENNSAVAHLENVEFTYVGQSFRLGRYPIHFHINGNLSQSYVRSCSVHKSFNRAINIHGSHSLVVEHNVIHNIKGGAIFLEDGIETKNVIAYNLAIFVKSSSSLLNDDITPATIWATNPDNSVIHNAVAGGTHFGIWVALKEHPEGPSFTESICPRNVPLGSFVNNSAHSFGWFGLWSFPDQDPKEAGSCSDSAPTKKAYFSDFFSWHCDKGAELVNAGAIELRNFVVVTNEKAGVEVKLSKHHTSWNNISSTLSLRNVTVIAYSRNLAEIHGSKPTKEGLVLPQGGNIIVANSTLMDFNANDNCAITLAKIDGTCTFMCGGFQYFFSNTTFINSTSRLCFDHEHQGVFIDEDGTLTGTGKPNQKVVPESDIFPPNSCTDDVTGHFSGVWKASICDDTVDFHRFAVNNVLPNSLDGTDMCVINKHGQTCSKFLKKRITHANGYVLLLVSNTNYTMFWKDSQHLTNVSFSMRGDTFDMVNNKNKFVILCMHLEVKPDKFLPDGTNVRNESKHALNISNVNGDWTYDTSTNQFCLIVSSNVTTKDPRRTHNGMPLYSIDRIIEGSVYKCLYPNCKPPPDPNTQPQNCTRPSDAIRWSTAKWKTTGNDKEVNSSGTNDIPKAGNSVTIPEGTWLVLDTAIPELDVLYIYGVLELDNDTNVDYVLKLNHIYIRGGSLIIGCNKTQRFEKNVQIILKGNESSPVFPIDNGPNVGAKSIGVFGGLYLHGRHVAKPWTKLKTPLNPGSDQIEVLGVLDWKVDDEIVITTTSTPSRSEVFKIKRIEQQSTYTTLTLNMSAKYRHKVFTNTIKGIKYEIAAEVGLLTRNIKIIGEPHANMVSKGFGMRIIAGVVVAGDTIASMRTYSAKVRVDGVQFLHGGQLGFSLETDPRYVITLLNLPRADGTPFYLERCSFHKSFSTAIGIYGTSNVSVSHNVIHDTVDTGIVTKGKWTLIVSNLISRIVFSGGYHDRFELYKFAHPGALEVHMEDTELVNNAISGSDRLGFRGIPQSSDSVLEWSGNIIRSCVMGYGLFPDYPNFDRPDGAFMISGFSFSLNFDFGIYFNQNRNLTIRNCVFIDNGISIFPMIIGASSVDHIIQKAFVNVTNNLFVGTTGSFDCNEDRLSSSDKIFKLSVLCRSFAYTGGIGKIGIVIATFTTGSNSAPTMDCTSLHSYFSIGGHVNYRDNIFTDFYDTKCGKDVMISLNPKNDDASHPVKLSNNTALNSNDKNILYLFKPRKGTINSADCIDMTCDGHRQVFIKDLDGLLFKKICTAVGQSEFEYDGDRTFGLGDYRIPKAAMTDPNGNKVDIQKLAPNKGIVRDSSCKWIESWRAYNCSNMTYRYLVLESMDEDTELRRLSPIAFFANGSNGGFVDIINGPQDHGWCSGYTCRKRLSTFLKVIAIGLRYDCFLTATAPQHMRFMMLDSMPNEKVVFGLYYKSPQRMDVYVNGVFHCPENADCINGDIIYKQGTVANFMPKVSSSNCGDNYYNRESSMVYALFCGGDIIEFKLHTQVFLGVGVPSVSVDEFFGANLINNLAALLNIPTSKIRSANTYTNTRRRRSAESVVMYYVYIGNPPCQQVNCDDVNATLLTYTDLSQIAVDLINKYQLGELSDILNVTVNGLDVTEAVPPVIDQLWADIVSNETDYVYNRILAVPTALFIQTPPVADTEGSAFSEQPRLQMLDSQGMQITNLGAAIAPWQIQATLRTGTGSNPFADLIGNTTISFLNGWANFTNLGISLSGTGYIIDFEVIYPDGANFSLSSDPITVNQRQLKASVVSASSDTYEGSQHEVVLEIRDNKTGDTLDNIAWSNLDWYVNASLVSGTTYTGSLSGIKSATFNPVTGRATFSAISLDEVGMAVFEFTVYSSPAQYEFKTQKGIVLYPTELASVVQDTIKQVSIKFDLDFALFGNEKFAAMFVNGYLVRYRYLKWSDVSVAAGSVIITVTFSGNSTSVDNILTDLCDSIKNGDTFTYEGTSYTMADYMTVDGSDYYTSSCVIPDTTISTGEKTPVGGSDIVMIVCLVLGVLLFALLILAIILWRLLVYPKTKTHKSSADVSYLGKGAFFFKDAFYRQDTFNSIRSENSFVEDRQCAPANTVYTKKKGLMTISSHY